MTDQHQPDASHRPLSFDDILAANDLDLTEHYVEKWGGVVWLRAMTGAERAEFVGKYHSAEGDMEKMVHQTYDLVASLMVDQTGNRIVPDGREAELLKKNASVLEALCTELVQINGLNVQADGESSAVEAAEKNS